VIVSKNHQFWNQKEIEKRSEISFLFSLIFRFKLCILTNFGVFWMFFAKIIFGLTPETDLKKFEKKSRNYFFSKKFIFHPINHDTIIVKKILDSNVEPIVLKGFKKESSIKNFFNFLDSPHTYLYFFQKKHTPPRHRVQNKFFVNPVD
jgi:hypothetical protein